MCLSFDGHPIYYRTDTTDRDVINDILVREEYDCVGQDVVDPKLIIDGGAYAGYSTLFFLAKYKNAHVIAVEPDDESFELCKLNLSPYGERVTLVHAAIWPEATGLVLHRGELADGREWATMVQVPKTGETPDVSGVEIGQLLRDSGFQAIDLLKMNIECSEQAVFSRSCEAWLPHVKNMIVQLHDEQAEDAFFRAMGDYQFLMSRPPTLFACTRIAQKKGLSHPPSSPSNQAKSALSNGGFEDLRVEPARFVPGSWLAGSTDIARDWQTIVCDPQFHASVAVRTGEQHVGENALLVRLNPNQPVVPQSAPYVAIESKISLDVRAGERWGARAFVKSQGAARPGLTRGAYLFLRLLYDDKTFVDLTTEPLMELSSQYVERTGTLQIPEAPPGRAVERATLWLYAWIANPGSQAISTNEYAPWEVLFDDVACAKI